MRAASYSSARAERATSADTQSARADGRACGGWNNGRERLDPGGAHHRSAAGGAGSSDRVGNGGGQDGVEAGSGRVVRRGSRTVDGLGHIRILRAAGDGGAHRERHARTSGSRNGDCAVQHGDGLGSRARRVRQPDTTRGGRDDQRAASAGDSAEESPA